MEIPFPGKTVFILIRAPGDNYSSLVDVVIIALVDGLSSIRTKLFFKQTQ